MTAYYNEIEPFAAQWLRNLIARGLIAPGDVDERSICDVQPDDLRGYMQCHFFAGIGGWSYALRLAGWTDDRPVWTGSCPCQPLSSAGLRKGHADKRHLWPAFYHLIAECEPSTVFGEQVAGKDGFEWFAGVRADLEGAGYACGAADLCAAGAGAPHIRQRLYWMADAMHAERRSFNVAGQNGRDRPHDRRAQTCGEPGARSEVSGLGDATRTGLQEQRNVDREVCGRQASGHSGPASEAGCAQWNGPTIIVDCTDGPRRIAAEPALFPVAARIPGDVGRLRGAGNAIVPQVAATFIAAAMECVP